MFLKPYAVIDFETTSIYFNTNRVLVQKIPEILFYDDNKYYGYDEYTEELEGQQRKSQITQIGIIFA